VRYLRHLVVDSPVDRAATLELARRARRFLVKTGQEIVRLDRRTREVTDADVLRYLLHDDGFLKVPVLVLDDLVVRGFTEDLYREALGPRP